MEAIDESRNARASTTAFAVGAIIVSGDDDELGRGHSREVAPADHAEEVALSRVRPEARELLAGATMYTSLEPCSTRRSRPVSCTSLIVDSGIRRVVLAAREPDLFVECEGVALLTAAGVEVLEIDEMAGLVRAVNAHLAWPTPVRH